MTFHLNDQLRPLARSVAEIMASPVFHDVDRPRPAGDLLITWHADGTPKDE